VTEQPRCNPATARVWLWLIIGIDIAIIVTIAWITFTP